MHKYEILQELQERVRALKALIARRESQDCAKPIVQALKDELAVAERNVTSHVEGMNR